MDPIDYVGTVREFNARQTKITTQQRRIKCKKNEQKKKTATNQNRNMHSFPETVNHEIIQ